MKNVLALAVSLLLFSTPALAATLGPAEPLAKPGHLALGTGVFLYSSEWERNVEVKQTQPYVQLGLGIAPGWEIYTQVGAADFELEADVQGETAETDDGYRPFASAGIRGLLTRNKPVNIGLFVQGSYFSNYESDLPGGETFEIEKMYEVNGGVSLQTVLEGAILYGGPLFYLRTGDLLINEGQTDELSDSIDEDSNFGGFVGIRWPLKSGMAIELEGVFKTKASVGGAIHYRF